ncbi:MAG: TolC family protein [Pseudomonadota bacterium]
MITRRLANVFNLAGAIMLILALSGTGRAAEVAPPSSTTPGHSGGAPATTELSLDACLDAALKNNHRRPASMFAVAMAEAQHRQALSGYWPQVNVRGAYQRMDEASNFIFPATRFGIPAQSITLPSGTALVTIPAGAFGNPVPIQLPVTYPGQTLNTPAQVFPVPEQDIKLMDPDSFMAALDAKWLVFDGGMRKGLREQSGGFVDMARQDSRRTDLELIDSVKRIYYGAVMARQLHQVGKDTLARMEATLNLTETMYKEGSGKVKKTDFLDNKVMVESIRSAVALLEKNEEMA